MSRWLNTDESEEAVSALEFLSESVALIDGDIYQWKWTILGLHNSLQGFMVIALRGGNGLAALRDDVAAEWLKAHETKTSYPDVKLNSFLNLYKKIKSDRILFYIQSKKFVPKGTQSRSVRLLNSLRNEFIHFVPKGWSLEISGLPKLCIDCMNIIKFLSRECGNIIWFDKQLEKRAEVALSQIDATLQKLNTKYSLP